MATEPRLELLTPTGVSRRAFWVMPLALAGWLAYVERPRRALPDAAIGGEGELITLTLFSDAGVRMRKVQVRKLVRTDAEWRQVLAPDEFAITRRAATEPPFTGRYWHTQAAGLYRCTCCGNALFASTAKFDSGTGWPSFTQPVATGNVFLKEDNSLVEVRHEVLCKKCDAHLGHVFGDGPAPTGQRYCLNSAGLRFCAALVRKASRPEPADFKG